ncbi:hypothetical protein AKJ16_DCAP06459 [Drosera capensis]
MKTSIEEKRLRGVCGISDQDRDHVYFQAMFKNISFPLVAGNERRGRNLGNLGKEAWDCWVLQARTYAKQMEKVFTSKKDSGFSFPPFQASQALSLSLIRVDEKTP